MGLQSPKGCLGVQPFECPVDAITPLRTLQQVGDQKAKRCERTYRVLIWKRQSV